MYRKSDNEDYRLSHTPKIPQIAVVFRNWSTLGLNSLSVLLEIIAGIILIFYCLISEFTILSYGESINILIQNMLLLYLTLIVDKRMKEIFLFTSLLVVGVSLFLANAFTKNILFVIYMYFSFPLSMIGKILQLNTLYKSKNSNNISTYTCLVMFLGAFVRIFTHIYETYDILMIISQI
ncbi:hypothetical protein HZS_1047 [Henneguya salminicola]|nr:hypothetical protein HZS_1047 [Henneguya salminicola]